jgi:hypothetical protein
VGNDKRNDIKMQRLAYERRLRDVRGNQGGNSSPDSSDSETTRVRDTAAQHLNQVDFRAMDNGQSAQWVGTAAGQPNQMLYDPSYAYNTPGGAPNYTAQAVLGHEMQHQADDATYVHVDHPDLRGVNFHLPGSSIESPRLGDSMRRQSAQVLENWQVVADLVGGDARDPDSRVRPDPTIAANPAWRAHLDSRVQYTMATPHQHNDSVAGELIQTLNANNLGGTQVANQVRAIYNEAYGRRMNGSGEVQAVGQVAGSRSARQPAFSNSLASSSGKKKAPKK